jgi:transcriptional regulator with XRE-family HTH domain
MAKLTFGQKLKQLRDEKGMSQEQLSKASGVNRRSIHTYEQELRSPTAESLFALSESLEVDCSAFKGCVFKRADQTAKPKKGK